MLLCVAGTALTARAQKVTLNFRNAKLEQVFGRITEQTGYTFYYARPTVNPDKVVSIAVADVDVRAALKQLLADDKVEIEIRDGKIYLSPPRQSAAVPQSVKGVVRDAAGQPVVGAAVIVKGTTRGVSSGTDGSFSFEGLADGAVLQVSALGYATAEIPVGNRSFVTVELKEDATLVDEVVVVGYGTQKKASVVGSIASVSVNDIRMPTAKISNNLAGQLAGVISVQRSGEPGASSTFWIRGISTFGSSTTPLVLVDGIERDLDLVDIEDIKDFSILKDAAATAIYGVRGANGVILITTREGIVGKPQINIRFEAGMVQPTKVPDMLDAVQFAELWNATAGSEVYTPEVIQKYRDGSDPDLYPNVDWVDYLYKDLSFNERVNVNVTGGGSTAKYYISGGFYNEDGLFARDNMKEYNTSVFYRKFNFRSNVEVQLHKYTKLNVNLATTFERKNEPGTASSTIWDYAVKSAPNVFPAVYSNGLLPGPGANNGENPYVLLTQTGYREKFYNTAQSLFSLTQDLGDWVTKGLTVTVKGSLDDASTAQLHALADALSK